MPSNMNGFTEIKTAVASSLTNAGKTADKNREDESKKNSFKHGETNKLKRSFMLTPIQIQLIAKIKLDLFVEQNVEMDLSEIVGQAIEEYYSYFKSNLVIS